MAMPPKPRPTTDPRARQPDAIVQIMRDCGVNVPDGCYQVTVNHEEHPTYVTFDSRQRRLIESDEEAAAIAKAIQVHKVGHKLRTSK